MPRRRATTGDLDEDDLGPEAKFAAGEATAALTVSLLPTGLNNIGFDGPNAEFDGPLTASPGPVAGYGTADSAAVDVVAVRPPRWFARPAGHPWRFTEGGGAQEVEVEVYAADPAMPAPSSLDNGEAVIQVSVSSIAGTADSVADDYTGLSEPVQFPASAFSVGEGGVQRGRVKIPVEVLQDEEVEGDETLGIRAGAGAAHAARLDRVRPARRHARRQDGLAGRDHHRRRRLRRDRRRGDLDPRGLGGHLRVAGDMIRFTVTFSLPATVTGAPELTFRMGASGSEADRTAVYLTGSGTKELVFAYTVVAADSDR